MECSHHCVTDSIDEDARDHDTEEGKYSTWGIVRDPFGDSLGRRNFSLGSGSCSSFIRSLHTEAALFPCLRGLLVLTESDHDVADQLRIESAAT